MHRMLNDFLKIVLNANINYLWWPQFQTNPFSSFKELKWWNGFKTTERELSRWELFLTISISHIQNFLQAVFFLCQITNQIILVRDLPALWHVKKSGLVNICSANHVFIVLLKLSSNWKFLKGAPFIQSILFFIFYFFCYFTWHQL